MYIYVWCVCICVCVCMYVCLYVCVCVCVSVYDVTVIQLFTPGLIYGKVPEYLLKKMTEKHMI